jgi:hypothetical protein
MSLMRKTGHAIASVLASYFLVAGLCGSSCTAAVCVEDCDPCFNQCLCHTQCNHAVLDAQTSHKLSKYRLAVAEQRDGTIVRTISEISGLSLDFADGLREHTSADFVRFAAGVIEFNGLLLQSRHGLWTPRAVETFDGAVVVPFASTESGASLTFLFDRRGNLVEIDEVRR